MAKVIPSRGGCWYCNEDTLPMEFCWEFDTNLHMTCLEDQLSHSMDLGLDPELEIIAREFGLVKHL